jgi:hypothetical protein
MAQPRQGPQLLTLAHVSPLINPKTQKLNYTHYTQTVLPILKESRELFYSPRGYPNAERYAVVFVTSDIHSDYRKLLELLINANIITLHKPVDLYSNDIYDPSILTEFTWNLRNTCFIVLGDIIDGRRDDGVEVADTVGCFELYIHILLYNMKIKSLAMQSSVLFTFGNHDLHSLLLLDDGMLTRYVATPAKNFFNLTKAEGNWVHFRVNTLLPFYEVEPYLYINIRTKKRVKDPFWGIHAGFHSSVGENIKPFIASVQDKMRKIPATKSINTLGKEIYMNILRANKYKNISTDGGLWSRYYNNQEACGKILVDNESEITVVGHCPTAFQEENAIQTQTIINNNNKKYDGCEVGAREGRGCVVLSCYNKVAHVDVGMSGAFHSDKEYHQHRDAEMLVLLHDPSLDSSLRYYNSIYRFSKTGGWIRMVQTKQIPVAAPIAPLAALETPPASPIASESPVESPIAYESPVESPIAYESPVESPVESPIASESPASNKSPFAAYSFGNNTRRVGPRGKQLIHLRNTFPAQRHLPITRPNIQEWRGGRKRRVTRRKMTRRGRRNISRRR